MEDIKKCRAINIFFPVLIIAYVGMSLLLAIVVQKNNIVLPLWSQYVLSQVFVLIPALIYAGVFRNNVSKEISYKLLKPADALLSLVTGYALIPMVLFIANVTMLFATNYLDQSTAELTKYPFGVQILIVAIIPPFVEEFVFRGLFYRTYRKCGIFAGALVSGIIFGLFHLNINQFCYAMVMGIVFAYMIEATGSMWSSMIAHFAVNTYSIGTLAVSNYMAAHSETYAKQYENAQQAAANLSKTAIAAQLLFMAVMAGVFMTLAILMIRKMAKRNDRMENMHIFGMKREGGAGFKNIISWPAIVTAVCCVIYMIFIEFQ